MHEETVRIVDAQMEDMGRQMEALDDFVAKARSQNGRYHEGHLNNLDTMVTGVRESYSTMRGDLQGLDNRVGQLQEDAALQKNTLQGSTAPLSDEVRQPLSELRTNVQSRPMKEYTSSGVTPKKRAYEYPSTLPKTEAHDGLIARMRNSKELTVLPFNGEDHHSSPLGSCSSPTGSKPYVYNDAEDEVRTDPPATSTSTSNTGLREVDANVARPLDDPGTSTVATPPDGNWDEGTDADQPPLKRHCSVSAVAERNVSRKLTRAGMGDRENIPPATAEIGRRLRGRPSG